MVSAAETGLALKYSEIYEFSSFLVRFILSLYMWLQIYLLFIKNESFFIFDSTAGVPF